MTCGINKIDSNGTGLAIAEEECQGLLPAVPTWYEQEPNSYSDFGGELTKMSRTPIDPSRQNKKGVIVDMDASAGFNTDFTKSNLTRLLQGFFFADAREMPTTQPLNTPAIAIASATAATSTYAVASGGTAFYAGALVNASGFANATNNGLKTVASSVAGGVTVAEALADEAAPPVTAKLESVGWQLADGDANLAVTGAVVSLIVTAADFTTMPELFPGRWLFIGGDAAANRFVNNVGYARIKSVTAKALIFDDVTWQATSESGAGKSIRIFSGTVIRNEKSPALIKRRTYTLERSLGEGANSTQAEYVEGCVANELTLNIPQADKLNADLAFVGSRVSYRSGDVGDERKGGTRVPGLAEEAFNTSSDLYRIKLAVNDPANSNPSSLFGYVSEATLAINNNVTPIKAIGVLGAFDSSAGRFDISGSMTAFFTNVAAVKAIQKNADVSFSVIGASKNAGFVFDLPLLGLGGGRLTVEENSPIQLPLESSGAENANGYTLLYQAFAYLPNVAMPV